jgi:hypothetical protein
MSAKETAAGREIDDKGPDESNLLAASSILLDGETIVPTPGPTKEEIEEPIV